MNWLENKALMLAIRSQAGSIASYEADLAVKITLAIKEAIEKANPEIAATIKWDAVPQAISDAVASEFLLIAPQIGLDEATTAKIEADLRAQVVQIPVMKGTAV